MPIPTTIEEEKFHMGQWVGHSFVPRSSLMKSFTGWNGVESRRGDGWREGGREETQVEGGGWGGDPGCLLKRLRRGDELVQVIGASWSKCLGRAGPNVWGELVQVFGASLFK